MASGDCVHRLFLPKNSADAYAAIREFAASLEETTEYEDIEATDEG